MSAIPNIYRSTDVGALALTDAPGALCAVLASILSTGYGAQSGAGWVQSLSGNIRAFRSSAGYFLEVQDAPVLPATTLANASVRAYSTHTALGTGDSQTPEYFVPKRSTAVATPAWWAIACNRYIWLFADLTGTGMANAQLILVASEITPIISGDAYAFFMAAAMSADLAAGNIGARFLQRSARLIESTLPDSGAVILRGASGALGTVPAVVLTPLGNVVPVGGDGADYPHPIGAGLVYSPIALLEGSGRVRGYLPGVYWPWHYQPYLDLQQDATVIPGVTLLAKSYVTGASPGQILFDRSSAQ
jgi:hypothetical protein